MSLRIDILTLFPDMFTGPLSESILKIARQKKLLSIKLHDIRKWACDKHRTADDKPYGGGGGMVLKLEPVYLGLKHLLKNTSETERGLTRVILLSPTGKKLEQPKVKSLAKMKRLILICGHYEGVDERVKKFIDEEISIGDYILSCGEIPACVLVDAVARLVAGVLGNPLSAANESFEDSLLEHPHYTRPREFKGLTVPEKLLKGNHLQIKNWRLQKAKEKTKRLRPDLFKKYCKK